MLGLFWKRASATGAFTGLMNGLFMAILLALDRKLFHATPLAAMNFLYVAPIIFAVSVGIIILVSLVTQSPALSGSPTPSARNRWNCPSHGHGMKKTCLSFWSTTLMLPNR